MAKILFIDDDFPICQLGKVALTEMGYEVETAADGEAGWNMIIRWQPDIVVTDLMMPKLYGLDLLERIRKDPRTSNLPVLCCTSEDDPAVKQEAITKGATGWVSKPFQAHRWKSTLDRILQKQRRTHQ